MGNFYVNVTVKGPTRDDLVTYLKEADCRAYVSPVVGGVTTVVADRCDLMAGGDFMTFAMEISGSLGCPTLAVLDHDDDILAYWLFEHGGLRHEYDSNPGYFSGEGKEGPKGGDAQALCDALGCPGDVEAVERALRRPGAEADDGFVFAYERHQALLDALGIPGYAVGLGWTYLEANEYPPGLAESDFVKV